MDLVDRIEGTRFLGSEFIVWLWFKSELFEGELDVTGFGKVELWLDTLLAFESQLDKAEKTTLRGLAPSATPEAREAIKQGKLPTRARFNARLGSQDYAWVLTASTLAISGAKIPALVADTGDEQFYERMHLLEELDRLMAALYAEFLQLRLGALWESDLVPAIRAWANGREQLGAAAYRGLLQRSSKGARRSSR
jgi:hypothetical protein